MSFTLRPISSSVDFRRYMILLKKTKEGNPDFIEYMNKKGLGQLTIQNHDRSIRLSVHAAVEELVTQYLQRNQPPDYPDNWTFTYHESLIEALESGCPTLELSILLSDTPLPGIHCGSRLIYDIERAFSLPMTGQRDKLFQNYARYYWTNRTESMFLPRRQIVLAARSGYVDIVDRLWKEIPKSSMPYMDFVQGVMRGGHIPMIEWLMAKPEFKPYFDSPYVLVWAVESGKMDAIELAFKNRGIDGLVSADIFKATIAKGSTDIYNFLVGKTGLRVGKLPLTGLLFKEIMYNAAGQSGCAAMIPFLNSLFGYEHIPLSLKSKYNVGLIMSGILPSLDETPQEKLSVINLRILAERGHNELFYYYFIDQGMRYNYSLFDAVASTDNIEILTFLHKNGPPTIGLVDVVSRASGMYTVIEAAQQLEANRS